MSLDSGNVHDSTAFYHIKDFLDFEYGDAVKTYVADAGYSTAPICHDIQKAGKEIIVPKKRTATRKKGCTGNGSMSIIRNTIFSHVH